MKNLKFLFWISVILILNGCYTYSSLQSARLLVKGKYEITPSYSSVSFSDEGESEKMTDNYGVQLGYGISKNANLRLRYEKISPDYSGSDGYSFMAVEPKFGLVKDKLAFSFPVGFFSGSGIDTSDSWQIHPSFHLTIPASKNLEINVSPKILIFLEEDTDDLIAFNAGLGISDDLSKWAFRPEIGYLINPGEDGHYFSWSLGVSFTP